ncbi:hypothetical protein GE061_009304 [Apolygus lucorum]|uniref:Uncharacterized protein n=1 Tax=Apolygus lucorum TaxID=248454 RepID=A0A6A4KCX9_APOLU|nr:hypothetical protein GE061_009304 [Apolygus lucorum]
MFDKLRNWTLNILECKTPNDLESCADFNYYSSDMDPRELPRPHKKFPSLELPSPVEERSPCMPQNGCHCHNCKELVELTECPICTGGYQRGVTACDHCGNVMCWSCAAKMPSCPFCRRPRPPARNTALERIFNKLQLPCNPSRLDSKKQSSSSMTEHVCLAKKDCPWTGELGSLAGHLEADHDISVLVGSGITIEIGGFRSKVRASDKRGRQYTVSLACYASIFVLNISLLKKKMRLLFTGASSHPTQRFGAWLEVDSSYRTMKGIMPVSTQRHKQKELFISCDGLLSPWRSHDDVVRMNITIRPLS